MSKARGARNPKSRFSVDSACRSTEFRVPGFPDIASAELETDDETWAQAVTLCGEMLKEIDGNLPPATEWNLEVCQAACTVATIN